MLTIVCFVIACISTITAIFFFRKSRKMEDNIRQAEADISHFLLYPEKVNKKSLEEGVCFNLLKQFYRKYGASDENIGYSLTDTS